MLDKLKNLFLLLSCCAAIGANSAVSAQSSGDKVLVSASGKTLRKSDVTAVMKFYEWAFETEFNAAERDEFRQLKEAEFRSDPAQAKKGIDEMSTYLPKVRASSESEQTRIREAFNTNFVAELRKKADDAEARFLLKVYDAAHGDGATTEPAADDADDEGIANNLSSVVGKWVWSNTGGTSWNSNGTYAGGNGSRFTYHFSPGGAVEYTGIMNVMTGGCNQQVYMSKKGSANLNGGVMTIRWSSGTTTRDFSCDRANNYTKNLPAENQTIQVEFKTNSTGQKLFCTGAGKDETCFSPTK